MPLGQLGSLPALHHCSERRHEAGYGWGRIGIDAVPQSLPVSPGLKLTDRGLVDVDRRAWADAVASHS